MKGVEKQLFTALLCFSIFCFGHQWVNAQIEDYVHDALMVKLKQLPASEVFKEGKLIGTGNNAVDAVLSNYEIKELQRMKTGKRKKQALYRIQFAPNTNLEEVIKELLKSGAVIFAEPDYRGKGGGVQSFVPNDPQFFRQWSLYNDGSFTLSPSSAGADIDMINAWLYEQGDSNIVVSILDSGARLEHPEFEGRIWTNYGELAGNASDDDANGYIDDIRGWDFVNNDNNPSDDHGHGTNVMGIVGLNSDNSLGFAGVDFHCKLMVLKVLNSQNFGDFSWFTQGVYYAVDNGANVINLSLGGSSPSLAFGEAIQYALNEGVVVVACMMNENNSVSFYPAAYPGVIAVGATNPNDTRSNPFFWSSTSGSCFGNHISVSAPGNFIYGLNFNSNTNYNSYWGGTSQAAPHVAGLAALLLAQDESRTPAQIKQIIEETSIDEVGSPLEDIEGFDIYHGHGRVNAHLALTNGITRTYLNSATPSWDIFPNPSAGRFRITPPDQARLIELMDVNGRLVSRMEVAAHAPIDLMLETTGVYVVKVIGDDFVQAKRLIIN